jgi:hypothetical protein
MRKFKKYWYYLLIALSISLTILVINDINDPGIPIIIQDINSGVIGAILTTIITLILLSNQTESQENLTKTSVVYEEKLKIFNSFLETLIKCLEDGILTASETTKIIHSFSILRIHISTENAIKIENALSSIDNSFFHYDENSIPNLSKLIELYTEITNVFREELYDEKVKLATFNFENLKKVLYRPRLSVKKPKTFSELLDELNGHSKILHRNTKTGITIVYDIDTDLIEALKKLHVILQDVISSVSKEIEYTFEINNQTINNERYCSIPWIKLHYKDIYFGYYGVSENKILYIGQMIPEKKQVASLEIFEIDNIDNIDKLKLQIPAEFNKILKIIDLKSNI